MSPKEARYDRQARLNRVEHLLCQNPSGLTLKELSQMCDVCPRTIRRDLTALEETMKITVWQDGKRWGVDMNSYLPPIKFSSLEALTILMAVRLYLRLSRGYEPEVLATFVKLNSIMPERFRDQVATTLRLISLQPRDMRYGRVLRSLCQSLLEGKKCRITYWTMGDGSPAERVIAPYSIEPVAQEHANYVIGWCDKADQIRTFKLDRIQECQVLDEPYQVPADFSVDRYLGNSWGIFALTNKPPKRIVLKVDPEVARYMEEVTYHPSQETEKMEDGSVKVTLYVSDTPDFIAWVLGWRAHMEVLEPPAVRLKIKKTAESICAKYR